jgi:hypothetical protein
MFQDSDLKKHLLESPTVQSRALVVAEWNMNIAENIATLGNYRFRPADPVGSKFKIPNNIFDPDDNGQFYTGATNSDIVIDAGVSDDNSPQLFISSKEKEKILFSLEDCFSKFRPRSGINKLRYLSNSQFTHFSNVDMFSRPRYYVAHKDDKFKYWTSYRREDVAQTAAVLRFERGIATEPAGDFFYIDDAAPFVVYKNSIPANRIVVKMQTGVGTINLGPFEGNEGESEDPFFGVANQTTPVRWRIQYLNNNSWSDAISFSENSVREDGTPIIGPDGYVEIGYGLIIPDQYKDIYKYGGRLSSITLLPDTAIIGQAFLVVSSRESVGLFHIWTESGYQTFVPSYGWSLQQEEITEKTPYVTDLTDPESFINSSTSELTYREFDFIQGIRIVAETMNRVDSTLDIIEISPRLSVDLTDKTSNLSLTKPASDLGISGMPVGQLLASTGNLSVFDYDLAMSQQNELSIVKDYLAQNIQVKIYDVVRNVPSTDGSRTEGLYDYFIPQKTMYVDGFPETNGLSRETTITLRDLFVHFESLEAPEMLIEGASLSYAIATMLDSVGFSNYVFKRIPGEADPVIPYFFIKPDKSVADVLNDLARSTQTTMFFDEYNNFVTMSKNYIMPKETERPTDIVLRGTKDFSKNGIVRNSASNAELANIIDLASQENKVYNDGKITYSERYIQRSSRLDQQDLNDRYRTYIYKPVELWSPGPAPSVISQNAESGTQGSYALSALPLNSNLSDQPPSVVNHQLVNNVLDFGESVDLLIRHQGYLYSNGEIIRYDAVEYSIPGLPIAQGGPNVWVSTAQEYEGYFSKLPFNGKMYKTGLVRIYSEPEYETADGILRLKNGPVVKHGRAQFNTKITPHRSGLDTYWLNNSFISGVSMDSRYLFVSDPEVVIDNASSSSDVVTVKDTTLVKVGQTMSIASPPSTGVLPGSPVVTQVINGTTFKISQVPTAALNRAKIILKPEARNLVDVVPGPAGQTTSLGVSSNVEARRTSRGSVIRNNTSLSFPKEGDTRILTSSQPGTLQSSAFIMTGRPFQSTEKPVDFVSYVHKPLTSRFKHFGTRMRIVGKQVSNENAGQAAAGEVKYYDNPTTSESTTQYVNISGSSGGLGVMVNPQTNNGYFFEIIALNKYSGDENLHDVIFYKVAKDKNTTKAIPVKLWGGVASITVDTGTFAGQSRKLKTSGSSVYDLAVEYVDIGKLRRFFLFVNGKQVATVDDDKPLPVFNNMALFVRGQAKCMFENIYALANSYAHNTSFEIDTPLSSTFASDPVKASDALNKYALSGAVQSTYLSGISPTDVPEYNIYFEEFGSIMREVEYFNIKYDKAYPALLARIAPTVSDRIKSYTVSGFTASSYGAQFLVFNNTDTTLFLNSENEQELVIHGIAFTDDTVKELTVDDFFVKNSDYSNPKFSGSTLISSPLIAAQAYKDIKFSRMTHGQSEFTLDAPYIQTRDDAYSMMSWLSEKIMRPRMALGLEIFSTPTIQLGDIVQLDIKDEDDRDQLVSQDSRFVVYNIEYSRSESGPSMKIYLSEVL